MSAKTVLGKLFGLSLVLAASGSIDAQEPKAAAAPKALAPASTSRTAQEATEQAVAQLADQLKRHPVEPKKAPYRFALYLLDVNNDEVTLIADQPAPGLTHCGSPTWSYDGRRILYDATPGTEWSLTRLKSIRLGDGPPAATDMGTGNCPTFSPTDDRIAFLSNADGVENGVWLMDADGSNRRVLGGYGKPMWSPDGRQLISMSFESPRRLTLMDADPDKSGVLQIPDNEVYSDPSWAGVGTIVAVIGQTKGDTVAARTTSAAPSCQGHANPVAESKRPRNQPNLPDLLGDDRALHLCRRGSQGHGALFGPAG